MLNSDALHGLIASPMQAERSSADGLNPASAVLGSARTARPAAAITLLRSVFFRLLLKFDSADDASTAVWRISGSGHDCDHKKSLWPSRSWKGPWFSGFLSAAASNSTLL
jgi:hypothetical protein